MKTTEPIKYHWDCITVLWYSLWRWERQIRTYGTSLFKNFAAIWKYNKALSYRMFQKQRQKCSKTAKL